MIYYYFEAVRDCLYRFKYFSEVKREMECEEKNEIEKLQEEAFMDGYKYAIQILQESMGKRKTNNDIERGNIRH
ncbi:hypothetical protein B5F07_19855 [Lachnoclostridium sp. An169]|uniref:hypothetical protein n=1 Tax=Lachnoclostridium sp. An169 TaxID=1965569 RepID=UPI000B38F8A0|nr:hypothetical protein [Lachnoclostridium sp. An169]OUP80763.1 hypothetical protein B5F07_19855 [Lachnoclostridium sp. An169]